MKIRSVGKVKAGFPAIVKKQQAEFKADKSFMKKYGGFEKGLADAEAKEFKAKSQEGTKVKNPVTGETGVVTGLLNAGGQVWAGKKVEVVWDKSGEVTDEYIDDIELMGVEHK